jgi:hypothetical protein
MQLPYNSATQLIRRLAREASQSENNSLFSLLLRLEQQIHGGTLDSEIRLVKSKASAVFNQQRPIMVYPRYIE